MHLVGIWEHRERSWEVGRKGVSGLARGALHTMSFNPPSEEFAEEVSIPGSILQT